MAKKIAAVSGKHSIIWCFGTKTAGEWYDNNKGFQKIEAGHTHLYFYIPQNASMLRGHTSIILAITLLGHTNIVIYGLYKLYPTMSRAITKYF